MIFNNALFKFVAELVDGSPVPVAIAGGAVRDEVNGREIKDFDILIHENHLTAFKHYLDEMGMDLVLSRDCLENGESYGELPDDFDSRYVDWLHYEGLADEYIQLDVLVLGRVKYDPTTPGLNFVNAVHLFDNTMNMYLYNAGVIIFLGGKQEKKLAVQSRKVSPSREHHVQDIAKEIGWTYVPLAQ